MERLRPLWEYLYAFSPSATLFQSHWLNSLAVRGLGEAPFVVAAETGSGAAIVPAAITGGALGFLGECLFDYRDILSSGEPDALALAIAQIARSGLSLRVRGLREDAHPQLWQSLGRVNWSAAPCVQRKQMGAAEFCAAHSRLASRFRKLQRAGAELRRHSGANSSLVRWIYQRKAQQIADKPPPNLFAVPARVEFMVAWCARAAAGCEIFCLEAGGKIVSALVTFRDSSTRRFYTVYFDAGWEKFSPGTVLVYEATRLTLSEGLDADFMTGEQPHKTRMASASTRLYSAEPAAGRMAALAQELAASTPAAA
ncbi:MAG: GNAT family N-acetyltransferase [Acidobacteria bacterium]|nr:GNAT family N-acetyltransferase [Acidobacteriota bacterium]